MTKTEQVPDDTRTPAPTLAASPSLPPEKPKEKIVIAPTPVIATLEMADSLANKGIAIARSSLSPDGERVIRLGLNRSHLIIDKALRRGDVLIIKFAVGLALTEFCGFWSGTSDGRAVMRALKLLAGYEKKDVVWGSGFASGLAACAILRVIEGLPIFGVNSESGPFTLFHLTADLRSLPDIRGWRDAVPGAPLPSLAAPPKPKPPPSPELSKPATDPFLAFHEAARSVLDDATFQAIEELAKEAPINV